MSDESAYRHQDIQELIALLDESARRDFIAFTLHQRRPHLHRLFVTASRRAYLARLGDVHEELSSLATRIKQKGHEDEDLCREAAETAMTLYSLRDFLPTQGRDATVEVPRVGHAAGAAAIGAAEDMAALRGTTVTVGSAVIAASRSLSVIEAAYTIDARASAGKLLTAVAMANVEVAVNRGQDVQLKWLKRRSSQESGTEKGGMSRTSRPSLMFYLGWDFVSSIIERRLFGGPYVRLLPLLEVGLWLYLTGAVLGRVRRDRLETLAKMFSDPGREGEISTFLRDEALKRLQEYGEEPESFVDFFMTTELRRAGYVYGDPSDFKRMAKEKIPLKDVEPWAKILLLEGIAFGASRPQLMEKVWRQTYETHKPEKDALFRQAGLDIPEEWTPLRLEQREQEVLLQVAVYATEYYPELVEPLGLRAGAGEGREPALQEREEPPLRASESRTHEPQPTLEDQWQAFLKAKKSRSQERRPPD